MRVRTQEEIVESWGAESAPMVSICCITYNQERYVSDAIESFLMQTTTFPFEIIIHDDASVDSTAKIINRYKELYPDIIRIIIQSENQYSKAGLIAPRFVFPIAKGKYMAICEGDDYWTDPNKLQTQVDFLENNPEYVITYSNCQPFTEEGLLDVDFGGATRDLSANELKHCTPLYTLTTCFRNVIKEVPLDLLSARYGDLVIWSLLGAYGMGKYLGGITPSAYRVHGSGVHSMKSTHAKRVMQLVTINALYAYYSRIDDHETARYFLLRSWRIGLSLVGLRGAVVALVRFVVGRTKSIVIGLVSGLVLNIRRPFTYLLKKR